MTFYKGCVKLPSRCPVSGIPALLRVEASWMKDRFVRWGSPVLLLWGQTACVSPSCVLFPASAFVRAVTIWSSTQSSQHTASSHSHLEHCQRDLELSLCSSGIDVSWQRLKPLLALSTQNPNLPTLPVNSHTWSMFMTFFSL